MNILKKDVVAIDEEFNKALVLNKSSLEYALEEANKSTSWLHACSVLVRAVLIDHVFQEGNKRTAAGIILGFFESETLSYNPELVAKAVAKIFTKHITNLTEIEKVIMDAVIR